MVTKDQDGIDNQSNELHSVGRLAALQASIGEIKGSLEAAPSWQASTALLAEVAWTSTRIERLQTAWGRKLTVALVGPSGAGKSTLLNALAGKELSASGITRPTTRQVIIYTHEMADAEDLLAYCGTDKVQIVTDYRATGLEHLILVDSPDTNTLPENQALLTRVLERADILLALFPALNPKLHDNITFLKPYVQLLPENAVIPILNWVDRVPLQELQEVILPDFKRWIAQEWRVATPIFLVSAKSSLPGITFPEDERPLHDINQIDALREYLVSSYNQASKVHDQRLASAEHLVDLLKRDCRAALCDKAAQRIAAREDLQDIGRRATQTLVRMPIRTSLPQNLATAVYTNLGQRWWGLVGWLILFWSLLLRLGAFFSHIVRRGRLTLPLGRSRTEQESLILTASELASWNYELEQLKAERWPPVTDALAAAGFSSVVRKPNTWTDWVAARTQQLNERWGLSYRDRLDKITEVLSFWGFQVLFNAPTLVLIGWLAYQTVAGFIRQEYLSLDYFRHSGITIGIVWLVSFILLQVIVSLALHGALKRSLKQVLAGETGAEAPLLDQFDALANLQDLCQSK
ncbi:MAG: dynamin family protein [Anaerolineae bacterium]